jgi:PIN domain nuclease of toxin-antitoxin system
MTCVLDASALLALLRDEAGGDIVAAALPQSIMCSVNVAEVVERLRRDFEEAAVLASVNLVAPPTIAADRDLAVAAGLLRTKTASAGLSLGDRFCLALAARMGMPVLTADRAWQAVARAVGVDVQLIR